jgi:hypothetical protein
MEVLMRKRAALVAVAFGVVLAVIALLENRQSAAQTTSMPNAFQDVPKVQKWEYKTIEPTQGWWALVGVNSGPRDPFLGLARPQ